MKTYKARTILIVEDVEETLNSFCKVLLKTFKAVYTARDGKSALKVYKEHKPDFVLTDLSIPLSSGEALCREIRKINPSQPLIVMTGHREIKWNAVQWDALIYKPVDYEELFQAFEHLESRMKAKDLERIDIQNLLKDQEPGEEEISNDLFANAHTRIVRIVSPAGFSSQEFIQEEDEWVVLLQGSAKLEIEGEEYALNQGEGCLLKSGIAHKILHTSESPLCIWLAVHMQHS